MTGQSIGMPVKVILVALGVLLATVVIAALVSTITTRLVLPSPEDAQPDSLPETATVDTPPVGVVLPSPEDAQPDRLPPRTHPGPESAAAPRRSRNVS